MNDGIDGALLVTIRNSEPLNISCIKFDKPASIFSVLLIFGNN